MQSDLPFSFSCAKTINSNFQHLKKQYIYAYYAIKRASLFVPPTVDLQILVGVRFVDVVLVLCIADVT